MSCRYLAGNSNLNIAANTCPGGEPPGQQRQFPTPVGPATLVKSPTEARVITPWLSEDQTFLVVRVPPGLRGLDRCTGSTRQGSPACCDQSVAVEGPASGRPLLDRIKGGRHSIREELRPGSTGRSEVRVLLAFDQERMAILLLGGDKSGDWKGWYPTNIPLADLEPGSRREEPRSELGFLGKEGSQEPRAAERVAEIEDEFRPAAGLTALREEAGISQREMARRTGVSQPRVARVEHSQNGTLDVLEQYIQALGGRLEIRVIKGRHKIPLLADRLHRKQ
ncbi:MAG: helix-turn-helix domain-containing protein [Actinomycetota bacterium]